MSSNQVAVTLTVSRAHIVVKRLRTRAVECFDMADSTLASFIVAETSSASAQAKQRLAVIREEVVSLLDEREEFELAAAKLRAEIVFADVRFGTSERMSTDIAFGTIAKRLDRMHKADDNGDANRQTISLHLPERVAKYAGLIRSE